jgi:Tfp pilus assembly protein PilW
MKRSLSIHRIRAFTVTEVMVASAVSLMIFAAVLTGVITFQRSFSGAIDYSRGTIDQQRVLDYLSRDIRRALTVTVSANSNTLTVTIPDAYASYDAQGNPIGSVQDPTFTSTGVANYGDPTKPITICYYVQNNQLLRQQTIGQTGVQSTLVIADSVELLQSSFQDLNCIVNYAVTFNPKMARSDQGNSLVRQLTTLQGSASVRNLRRD